MAVSSDALIVRVLTVLASIALLAMPFLARRLVERFSDSTFAEAVISQGLHVSRHDRRMHRMGQN